MIIPPYIIGLRLLRHNPQADLGLDPSSEHLELYICGAAAAIHVVDERLLPEQRTLDHAHLIPLHNGHAHGHDALALLRVGADPGALGLGERGEALAEREQAREFRHAAQAGLELGGVPRDDDHVPREQERLAFLPLALDLALRGVSGAEALLYDTRPHMVLEQFADPVLLAGDHLDHIPLRSHGAAGTALARALVVRHAARAIAEPSSERGAVFRGRASRRVRGRDAFIALGVW